MPRQNRVLPTGEIIAHPARGRFMGNRGILHDASGHLGRSRWKLMGWVTCVLDFKGRQRTVMSPGTYTELFFHDEAVALAAGHRPCAECRRADYRAYRAAAGLPGLAPDFENPEAVFPADGSGGINRTICDNLLEAQSQHQEFGHGGREVHNVTSGTTVV